MQRINTTTKFTDLFGAGKHGFRDGNKASGIPATAFNAAWCNTIQEEIANFIEMSGGTLDAGNLHQMYDTLVSVSASAPGAFVNYKAAASGLNANITMSADALVLSDGAGKFKTVQGFSATINSAVAGVNGLDTGVLAANTWYYKHAIYNPTTDTNGGILSLSKTAPTLPSGFTFFMPRGVVRTDGTGNKYPKGMDWLGNDFKYRVNGAGNVPNLPLLMSGANGSAITPTWVAAGISNYVPAISSHIDLVVNHQNAQIIIAPNNQFGGDTSTTNPPPYGIVTGTLSIITNHRMMLEDVTQIYAAISNIGTYGGINVLGGRVNL